jgi:hypothetical protein
MKNLATYHRAWELRQQGLTYKEIGKSMGYLSGAWPQTMVWRTNYKIATQKRLPNELKLLVEKYDKVKVCLSLKK